MAALSHSDLVKIAARWLTSAGCGAVVTEMVADDEIPDAMGWMHGVNSILIECKTSRSDFYADKQKVFRIQPEKGMGLCRYFLAPKGLLNAKDVEGTGWGLLETVGKNVKVVVSSKRFLKRNKRAEMYLLVAALRRVQYRIGCPLCDIVRFDAIGTSVQLLEEPVKFEYI